MKTGFKGTGRKLGLEVSKFWREKKCKGEPDFQHSFLPFVSGIVEVRSQSANESEEPEVLCRDLGGFMGLGFNLGPAVKIDLHKLPPEK